MDFDELDEVAPMRLFDLVVFGATGYTGCLAVEHLDALLSLPNSESYRWAIAGRNEDKLKRIAAKCKKKPSVVVASTKEEIHEMARECHVLLALAGPYLECGDEVVKACVEHQTHYIDVSGEVIFMHRNIERYHDLAKEKGVMIVHCAGAVSTPEDICSYLLVQKCGPLKQLRQYTFGYGMQSGGSFGTGLAVVETMLPDTMRVFQNPFSLGGERKCGIRSEDNDCRETEPDLLFPSAWVMPAYASHTTSRILRRSCALFEERPPSDGCVSYGENLSVVVRDLSLEQKDAAYAVWANPVPADIKDTMKQTQTLEEMRKRGLAPSPGLGPPKEARSMGFMDCFTVAEMETGGWTHAHFTGPEGYEVTAITCVAAALVLLEEKESIEMNPEGRGGALTPAFAFHGTKFLERLQAFSFAAGGGRKIFVRVADGQPDEKEVLSALQKVAERKRTAGERLASGSVKAWDVPALLN
eukprot:TRINITY_DN4854_c4_g1_i1.p1 TRINITY_DN4854_c4_g1~~TRINITY_DN4854_c4_g1_i1.p1  ORF type:complete len:497 (-),score=95.88 TRINITY_DN4854_c4_g1_i1:121-1530(-)